MIEWLTTALRPYPEIVVFLAVGFFGRAFLKMHPSNILLTLFGAVMVSLIAG